VRPVVCHLGEASGSVGLTRKSAGRRSCPLVASRSGLAGLPDPVGARGRSGGGVGLGRLRQFNRQRRRRGRVVVVGVVVVTTSRVISRLPLGEEAGKVGRDGEARRDRVERGVRRDLGRGEIELLAPDQARVDALRDDRLEEAAEDIEPVAVPEAGEAGMVGERLGQVGAQVPA